MATETAALQQHVQAPGTTRPKWLSRLRRFGLFVVVPVFLLESLLAFIDYRRLSSHTHVVNWGVRRAINLKEASPGRDIRWVPSGEFLEQSDGYLQKREYSYQGDENGFLKPSFVHHHPEITLVFQGGSTTEIVFVDPERRFPYLVGRMLEQATGKKVNSLNNGVSGAHSLDAINVLINKLPAYRPTFVVLMENINDLNTLLYNRNSYHGQVRSTVEQVEQKPFRRERSIVRSSLWLMDAVFGRVLPHIYSRVLGAGAWLLGIQEQGDEFAAVRKQEVDIDPQAMRERFRQNLLLYILVARHYGVTPVLMTQASRFYDDNPEWQAYIQKSFEKKTQVPFAVYRELHRSLNEVIREVGRSTGVLVIDLEKRVPARSEFIHDLVHFNQNGSQLAARTITNELMARYFSASAPQALPLPAEKSRFTEARLGQPHSGDFRYPQTSSNPNFNLKEITDETSGDFRYPQTSSNPNFNHKEITDETVDDPRALRIPGGGGIGCHRPGKHRRGQGAYRKGPEAPRSEGAYRKGPETPRSARSPASLQRHRKTGRLARR